MEEVIGKALWTIALVMALLLLKASVVAFVVGLIYSRPGFCQRVHEAYADRPRRAFVIGLVNTLLLLFIVAFLLNVKPLGLLGIFVFAGLCALHLAGRTARYREVAEQTGGGQEAVQGFTAWIRAGALVELAFLAPLVGQIVYLVVTMRCAGACTLALLGRGGGEEPDNRI